MIEPGGMLIVLKTPLLNYLASLISKEKKVRTLAFGLATIKSVQWERVFRELSFFRHLAYFIENPKKGINAQREVTSHGLAINCNTEMSWFGNIVPCGIVDKVKVLISCKTDSIIDFLMDHKDLIC